MTILGGTHMAPIMTIVGTRLRRITIGITAIGSAGNGIARTWAEKLQAEVPPAFAEFSLQRVALVSLGYRLEGKALVF
jgi:hypothetical protein